MRVPRVQVTVEWVRVPMPRLRDLARPSLKWMLAVVAVLAILSKGGVWLYREWPRPYMEYIRINGPSPGRSGDRRYWFDTRRPEEAAALARLKAQWRSSRVSHGWGKGG